MQTMLLPLDFVVVCQGAADVEVCHFEAGIAAVIGHPVTVRCIVANIELPPASSDDLFAEARRIFADDLADVGEVS